MPYKNHFIFLLLSLASITAYADKITLTNGDILEVELIKETDSTVTFSHAILGELTINKENISQIEALNPKVEVEEVPKQIETVSTPKVLETTESSNWTRSIDLGVTGASGATNNIKIRSAVNIKYEDESDRWDFKTFYLFSEEDSVSTENKVNAILIKDWFFNGSDWFAFASVSYDWDTFKDWDHRLQVSIGPGYQFVKTEQWEFAGRIGGTGVFEFNKSIEEPADSGIFVEKDTQDFDAMVGIDLLWYLSEKQLFTLSNYFYPSITNSGEYRNVSNAEWKHSLDFAKGLALKLGVRNEYDTTETFKNDLKYNVSLSFGF